MNDGAPLAQVFAAAEAGVALGRTSPDLVSVPLDTIVPCRWQPRQVFEAGALLDLAKDIEQHGVLTPPLVWMNEDGEWELIAGERRVRACYALCLAAAGKINPLEKAVAHVAEQGFGGLARELRRDIRDSTLPAVLAVATVPCREVWGSVAQLHELALVDNLQRADLTALEEARALKDLIGEYGYSQRVLGERLGKSQTWVSQRLNLLGLTPEVAGLVERGEVDPATAREIARLEPGVQAQAVAHMKQYGLKSKAAQNVVTSVLALAEPGAVTDPQKRPASRLAAVALARLPNAAARQAAALDYAARSSDGKPVMPAESHKFVDLLAATGAAGKGAQRYDVNVNALWSNNAPELGFTCDRCRINPHRQAVGEINDLVRSHHETHLFNDERWPKCSPTQTTCFAFTAEDEALALPTPYLRDFTFAEAELPHVAPGPAQKITDVATWVSILRRKFQLDDTAAARQANEKASGLALALQGYIEAQASADFDAGHFWSQPCERCVFHKVGSDDPTGSCQYQANAPAWDNYDRLVARLWESGNAPKIGRCRLFRLKSPEDNLPDLPGGLDLDYAGMIYLLRALSAPMRAGGIDYAAAWLDVKRTRAWSEPTWTDAEPVLGRLIPHLRPGQRLALVLLWDSPLRWTTASYVDTDKGVEATAYVPGRQAYTFSVARSFRR